MLLEIERAHEPNSIYMVTDTGGDHIYTAGLLNCIVNPKKLFRRRQHNVRCTNYDWGCDCTEPITASITLKSSGQVDLARVSRPANGPWIRFALSSSKLSCTCKLHLWPSQSTSTVGLKWVASPPSNFPVTHSTRTCDYLCPSAPRFSLTLFNPPLALHTKQSSSRWLIYPGPS